MTYGSNFLDLDYTDIPWGLYPSRHDQLTYNRYVFLSFLVSKGYLGKGKGLLMRKQNGN